MRHAFHLRFCITLAALAFWAGSAPAAILEYRAEFGNPTHTYEPFTSNILGTNYALTQPQLIGPVPLLTGAATAGDQFRIVFSAPTGSLFSLLPPQPGAFEYVVQVQFFIGQVFNGATVFTDTTASLVGASVPPPAPLFAQFVSALDGENTAAATFAGIGITFKSIVITTTIPEGFLLNFRDVSPRLFFEVYSKSTQNVDPGPLISLIDEPTPQVPEPASILLVPGALALIAARNPKFRESCSRLVTRTQ
jgi:hypothetical protein